MKFLWDKKAQFCFIWHKSLLSTRGPGDKLSALLHQRQGMTLSRAHISAEVLQPPLNSIRTQQNCTHSHRYESPKYAWSINKLSRAMLTEATKKKFSPLSGSMPNCMGYFRGPWPILTPTNKLTNGKNKTSFLKVTKQHKCQRDGFPEIWPKYYMHHNFMGSGSKLTRAHRLPRPFCWTSTITVIYCD